MSIDGYKYYLIFVDHYTHYIWLYPLRRKSEVRDVFTRFKELVENRFNKKIITLYSDNGGEYIALVDYLATNGITHLTTPPHTPEHNGFSERRHRHLVETGLALLSHASVLQTYWPYALATATYLINRLPTATLESTSPYHKLFGHSPNYSKLKVFGCLCYPWLRPYTHHKLESRSRPCVFLGYSLTQSAFLCLDPATKKIFVSRHVQFFEATFPFQTLTTQPSSTTIFPSSQNWCPPVMPLSAQSIIPLSSVPQPCLGPSPVTPSSPSNSSETQLRDTASDVNTALATEQHSSCAPEAASPSVQPVSLPAS